MRQHFLILGRNPLLSCWEAIRAFNLTPGRFYYNPQYLLADFADGWQAQEAIARLGGTIKIGRIIKKINKADLRKELINLAVDLLQKKRRPIFGLSCYEKGQISKKEVERLGLSIKKELKNKKISSRLVISSQTTLSSVVVTKNKLLKKGAELVLLFKDSEILIGQTEVVQDFEDYSRRDYGRPSRDSHSGMLPPKLAKIMINLAQIEKGRLLLDPFCGSGTILQEAALLGYRQLVGSDLSAKAVTDTKNNLAWLAEKSEVNFQSKVIKADCCRVFDQIKNIGGVVTEPYLGPVNINPGKLAEISSQISDLYLSFLTAAAGKLSSQTPLVMVWPVWRIKGKKQNLDILDQIKKLGFEPISLKIGEQSRSSVIYQIPNQRVVRQIFVFVKK